MNSGPLEWAEKYRPATLRNIAGQSSLVKEMHQWAAAWERGRPKDKALILHGRPGVGKTSAAHALAREMGWDVIELNASDQRTAAIIQKVAGSASRMGTFDGISGRRLIILDEADNLHGNYDRGGAKAIIQVVRTTSQPIILIANEFYDITSSLRTACKPVQFRAVGTSYIVSVLRTICSKEGVAVGVGVLEKIADNAKGDLRSAINDLQAVAIGKKKIELNDVVTSPRDNRETVFGVIEKIFKAPDIRSAQEATWQVDESPEDLILWIDENLPIEYKKDSDMAAGYFRLARADQFLGRVRKRQNYGLWRYASLLMSGGVSAARTQNYPGRARYQFPQYMRKMGQTRSMRSIRDSTALKIGRLCHLSKQYARSELIGFFKRVMKSPGHSVGLAIELDLNPEEIAFLLDTKPTTKKVETIYEAAQELMQKEVEHDIEVFGGFGESEVQQADEDIEEVKEPKSQSSLFDF